MLNIAYNLYCKKYCTFEEDFIASGELRRKRHEGLWEIFFLKEKKKKDDGRTI